MAIQPMPRARGASLRSGPRSALQSVPYTGGRSSDDVASRCRIRESCSSGRNRWPRSSTISRPSRCRRPAASCSSVVRRASARPRWCGASAPISRCESSPERATPSPPRTHSARCSTSPAPSAGHLEAMIVRGGRPHEVAAAFLDQLRPGPPCVVILEDLHWADDATLDVIRLLARKVESAPILVVGTYRDDQIDRSHPLRVLIGDIATSPAVARLGLGPAVRGSSRGARIAVRPRRGTAVPQHRRESLLRHGGARDRRGHAPGNGPGCRPREGRAPGARRAAAGRDRRHHSDGRRHQPPRGHGCRGGGRRGGMPRLRRARRDPRRGRLPPRACAPCRGDLAVTAAPRLPSPGRTGGAVRSEARTDRSDIAVAPRGGRR